MGDLIIKIAKNKGIFENVKILPKDESNTEN